jgi:hypothetical protein
MLRNAGRAIALLAVLSAALACSLLSSNTAQAADYSVDFGVDTVGAGKDAGSITCQLKRICSAKMGPLSLTVSIHLSWKESGQAVIRLKNDDSDCCYFAGGGESVTIDARTPVSQLPFFKGTAPRGSLFIQNERVGTLYLRFHIP